MRTSLRTRVTGGPVKQSFLQSYAAAFGSPLFSFALFFPGFWLFTIAVVGFFVYSFWNNWALLRGVYSITWVSMVVPALSLTIGTYWWHRFQGNAFHLQGRGIQLLTALLVLFIVIWLALHFKLRLPLDRKLFALFILQLYIVIAASWTALFNLVPYNSCSL